MRTDQPTCQQTTDHVAAAVHSSLRSTIFYSATILPLKQLRSSLKAIGQTHNFLHVRQEGICRNDGIHPRIILYITRNISLRFNRINSVGSLRKIKITKQHQEKRIIIIIKQSQHIQIRRRRRRSYYLGSNNP